MRNNASESCPVRCAVRYCEGESLLLRVEVVAQVLESAAGEMLTAAGKNHSQEGGREWEVFVQEKGIKQPDYTVRASVALIKCDIRLIQQQKHCYNIPTGTHSVAVCSL